MEYVESTQNIDDLKLQYTIKDKLGSGSFGKVFLAENKKDASIIIAIKKISKKKMSEKDLEGLKNEVAIMQHIDHPNIAKYFETYDTKDTIYLCMELCDGGELSIEKIKSDHARSFETSTAIHLEKIILALKHCHD
jgi:calcium-dependent protein kinase